MIKNEMTQYTVEEATTSWGQWRLIWIIVFVTGLVIVARDTETARETLIGLDQLHRVVGVSILVVIASFLFLKRPFVPFKSILLFLTLFSCWQILTALWSTFPSWTLYRSVEYFIMVLITAYCASSLNSFKQWTEWVNLIWFLIALLLFSVWLGFLFYPDLALTSVYSSGLIPYHLSGLFPRINSNSVSMYGAIIGIVSFVRLNYSSEKKWKILFLLAILTMILTQGRSGMGGFALGIIIAIMLMRRAGWLLIVFTIVVVLITFYAFDEIFMEFFRRGQTEDQFFLFSGRRTIWQYTYDKFIVQQPLTGFGAYSSGRFLVLGNYLGWSSLHSTWIEIAVGNGVPATILFAFIVIYCWFVLVKHCVNNYADKNNHYFIEISAVYSALIFRSIFTTVFFVHSDIVFFLVVGSVFFISKKYRYQ